MRTSYACLNCVSIHLVCKRWKILPGFCVGIDEVVCNYPIHRDAHYPNSYIYGEIRAVLEDVGPSTFWERVHHFWINNVCWTGKPLQRKRRACIGGGRGSQCSREHVNVLMRLFALTSPPWAGDEERTYSCTVPNLRPWHLITGQVWPRRGDDTPTRQ